MNLPLLYAQWFNERWPKNKIKENDTRLYCLQTLRSIQGTHDAGHDWYKLLSKILIEDLGMKACNVCKGIFSWAHNGHNALLARVRSRTVIF